MNILAIDPATRAGWAHSSGASGTWDLSVRRDESSGMRLLRLRGKLQEIKNNAGVDLIIFEAARHAAPGMAGAVVVQSEIQGVIKLWAEENKIPYRGFSPSEVKKRATGKGNANKQAVMDAAKEHWGRLISDDNEADALWLLVLGQETLGIKERPHDVETGL